MDEWYGQMRYKYDNRKKPVKKTPPPPPEDGSEAPPPEPEPEPEPDVTDPKDIPVVPYQKLDPTASQYILYLDGK